VTAAASPADDIPELQPIEDEEPAAPKVAEDEELVVSEWPDPAESSRG
jgi:hypothetical protein